MNRRNKYLTLSHIVEKCVQPKLYTLLRIRKRQNERILIFIPPLKVGDFITRNKARNAFLAQGFFPSDSANLQIIFHLQYKTSLFLLKSNKRTTRTLILILVSHKYNSRCGIYFSATKVRNIPIGWRCLFLSFSKTLLATIPPNEKE